MFGYWSCIFQPQRCWKISFAKRVYFKMRPTGNTSSRVPFDSTKSTRQIPPAISSFEPQEMCCFRCCGKIPTTIWTKSSKCEWVDFSIIYNHLDIGIYFYFVCQPTRYEGGLPSYRPLITFKKLSRYSYVKLYKNTVETYALLTYDLLGLNSKINGATY